MDMLRLTLRVDLAGDRLLGPGKILLLEAIEHTGSISQAGRMIGMSYRKAWWLVEDMNSCFSDPVIEARRGGSNGGGARLTRFGHRLIGRYRAIETEALAATRSHLDNLEAVLKAEKVGRPHRPNVRGAACNQDHAHLAAIGTAAMISVSGARTRRFRRGQQQLKERS